MLRYVLPLSAAMFVTLLVAGEDKGQMRPGLARAVASGDQIVMVTRTFSPTVTVAAEPERVQLTATDLPPPVELAAAPTVAGVPKAEPPVPESKPVFTLSSLPDPSGDRAEIDPAATDAAAPEASLYADPTDGGALSPDPASDALADTGMAGDIRTVSASSVNVRLGPSTDTSVVGRLSQGESVRILGAVDSEWVEVLIEGDGVSGYVASRFLTAGY
ncbi:SH3 domain-containing protein [Pseudogemmobacter bohemicus]|uniref:SH3 domain-containing protein n=1 Tax=Pseudogemmobacter bohemicus TaxID=2250708 RepID=UPI000DD30F9E|nr:SH3 domain-containing protein [Pseudogemmobacter bohemicus]